MVSLVGFVNLVVMVVLFCLVNLDSTVSMVNLGNPPVFGVGDRLRVIPIWFNFWHLNLGQLGVIPIRVNSGRSQFGSTWDDLNLGQLG